MGSNDCFYCTFVTLVPHWQCVRISDTCNIWYARWGQGAVMARSWCLWYLSLPRTFIKSHFIFQIMTSYFLLPQTDCVHRVAQQRIRYQPSLFQHTGFHSSLQGKKSLLMVIKLIPKLLIRTYFLPLSSQNWTVKKVRCKRVRLPGINSWLVSGEVFCSDGKS